MDDLVGADLSVVSVVQLNAAAWPGWVHAGRRMRLIGGELEALAPTVVNLQEVHTYDLLRILRRALPSYRYLAYQRGLVGPNAGLVTLCREPLQRSGLRSFGPAGRLRQLLPSAHKAVLVSRLSSRPVTVLNAHLTANTDGDWSTTNRFFPRHRAELRKLLALAREPDLENQNLLLSGDFNLARESQLYDEFQLEGGWTDPLKDDDSPTFHREFLPPGAQPRRIDYIFARAGAGRQCLVQRAETILTEPVQVGDRPERRLFLSDHVALLSELSFRRSRSSAPVQKAR